MSDFLKNKISNLLKICNFLKVGGSDGQLQTIQMKTLRNIEDAIKVGQFGFNSKAPVGTRGVVVRLGDQNIVIANEFSASIIDVTSGNTVVYNQNGDYIKLENGTITFQCSEVIFNCNSIKHNGVSIDENHIHSQDNDSANNVQADTNPPIN